MSAASALIVPCSSTAGRHGRSGLGAARRRRPGAAGQRATADHRVATFSPFLSFLRQSTHLPRGTCSWVGLEPASFYPWTGSHAFFRCQLCQPKSLHVVGYLDRGRKPSEAILGARWTALTPVQASVQGLCRRRVQREEALRQHPGLLFRHGLEVALSQPLPTPLLRG